MDVVRHHINEAKAYLAKTDPEWDASVRASVNATIAVAEALVELLNPPGPYAAPNPEPLPEPVRLRRPYDALSEEDEVPADAPAGTETPNT